MKEIPLTQGKVALVDDEDYDWLSRWKWHATLNGCHWYAVRKYRSDDRKRTVYMHQFILGKPGVKIDHKDGSGLNNRRENLRQATCAQNNCNRRKGSGCSSAYKGVSWYKSSKRWHAYINNLGVRKHLGYFDIEVDAARAYDKAAKELHGPFARLNFPEAI